MNSLGRVVLKRFFRLLENKDMKILAIFTCYNRKEKTKKCIETITKKNSGCEFTFVIADDGSTDGTYEMLHTLMDNADISILRGNGGWFYSKGMNAGMNYALQSLPHDFDYMLMINDDVEFYENCIQKMIQQSQEQNNAVVVGAMRDDKGRLSYGAVKYVSGYKYRKLNINEWRISADTFNANCVLVPYEAFEKIGAIDSFYVHSLGDFDYGLSLKKAGYQIYQSNSFMGTCNNNSNKGTWTDTTLNRTERIKRKESIKGAPTKQWFYFLKKNFGIFNAIKGTVTPFVRIMIGK